MLKEIRKLYTPIQPEVKGDQGGVAYQEMWPHVSLQPYIYCYWQLKTTQNLGAPFVYRVVSDGCVDVYFDANQPKDSFVMGLYNRYTAFTLAESFNYIGIRFLPTMFSQLFKVDAATLSEGYVSLADIMPKMAHFLSIHFDPEVSPQRTKDLLDTYFLKLMESVAFDADPRLYGAIAKILNHNGVVNLTKGLDTGLSPRQLRRLFNFYIGSSAKSFCQIVRFQNILRVNPSPESLRENKLFFDVGYYDQAHFIKAFKKFYGITPNQAFGNE